MIRALFTYSHIVVLYSNWNTLL